jgi:beta-glucosidase
MDYHVSLRTRNPNAHPFLFATGIENSYPTITGRDGKTKRIDEMAKTGHYQHWRQDLGLVKELGLEYLRYGPPYHRVSLGPDQYDWTFADETFAEIKRLGIIPIVDLCHFGVPDWIGNFQNGDWPDHFARYARAFAERFPWVQFYTPVNEIFVCARFSAQLGWWNERLTSDQAFVTALKHMVKANVMAQEAIIEVQPQALFVQSESTEHFHPDEPSALPRAMFYNQKRFLSLDLCYGHDVSAMMYEYLLANGCSKDEYYWFLKHGSAIKSYCIMGNDYYLTNEHMVPAEGAMRPAGEIFGYAIITKQYFDRYQMPVMHTETNLRDVERAPYWLQKQWANMIYLRHQGVPIIGFTWYSLIDQVDWDTALREDNGTVNELGLYSIDRKIRPVGEAYRKLVSQWHDILPMESMGLDLHRAE